MVSNGPLALVVEDDPFILMDACDILADAGFSPVANAIEALEQHADNVRVLFTDVQMPGGRDGFSLAMEAARRWPSIWIVVASGKPNSALKTCLLAQRSSLSLLARGSCTTDCAK